MLLNSGGSEMVGIERLIDTNEQLIRRLREGGLSAIDRVLNTTRKTAATYRYSYDRYLQYFRDKPTHEVLTEQDLYVGFGFAYSWMATIKQLDPRIKVIASAVDSLNRVRAMHPEDLHLGDVLSNAVPRDQINKLETLIEPIRKFLSSVIGSSKLLHFVNPDVFPIWDSTIHRYWESNGNRNSSDSLNRYIVYVYNIHTLINDTHFENMLYRPLNDALNQAHEVVKAEYKAPEPMGKVRAAEFVMFFGGRLERIQ